MRCAALSLCSQPVVTVFCCSFLHFYMHFPDVISLHSIRQRVWCLLLSSCPVSALFPPKLLYMVAAIFEGGFVRMICDCGDESSHLISSPRNPCFLTPAYKEQHLLGLIGEKNRLGWASALDSIWKSRHWRTFAFIFLEKDAKSSTWQTVSKKRFNFPLNGAKARTGRDSGRPWTQPT